MDELAAYGRKQRQPGEILNHTVGSLFHILRG
jgi:hypothetical protein